MLETTAKVARLGKPWRYPEDESKCSWSSRVGSFFIAFDYPFAVKKPELEGTGVSKLPCQISNIFLELSDIDSLRALESLQNK